MTIFRLTLLLLALLVSPVRAEPPAIPASSEDAIRLAAQYVAARKLDVSQHRVLPARFFKTGPLTNTSIGKGPCWLVTYELPAHDGGQYFVLIYLDGKIGHTGGM